MGLSESEREILGRRIDDERGKRGMTIKQLATKAGCAEKSVRNVIKGLHSRGNILSEICTVLGLTSEDAKPVLVSDDEHGGYTKNSFSEYVGKFLAYRRSFSFERNILRSVFDIRWSDHDRCLIFDEHQRYESAEINALVDHSQSGEIYVSNTINLLHFVTTTKGAIRLITVSKFRLNDPDDLTMSGIVLTQAKKPLHYQPSTGAIIFEKMAPSVSKEEAVKKVGVLRTTDFDYDRVYRALTEVERHIVHFALTPAAPDSLNPERLS